MKLATAARPLFALVYKESVQIVRDPSAVLIAFVLPVILLLLFAYAVSLDIRQVPIGVVVESDDAQARSLAAAFAGSRYFAVTPARDRREVAAAVVAGRLRGFVVIPQDFATRVARRAWPAIQIVTDGAQPNTARFVENYANGVIGGWAVAHGLAPPAQVELEPRFWFNPELETRRALIPGSIAIVMTMIGTLLTALVVAREWERGTMEAILATPVSVTSILLGKLLPYFVLGLAATIGSALIATHAFGVPLRGSWSALLLVSAAFLVPALGQGLLISVLARNQFVASQIALFSGFLPAFLLSGFLFEIASMPAPLRVLTDIVPARYFVSALQTVFLAGDVWPLLVDDALAMLGIGAVLIALVRHNLRKSLEG
ncbi:MAG: ABC transporter permease [Gammaproteobacteria bacterium]|nr:ABC transporter permease [Gammaproteobacteria bacterium]MCP5199914.1 ABC transporter permease [Gammaproteobacteria bacterium]